MQDRIFEYIRDYDNGNKKIGIIVGFVYKGQIVVGFSKTNTKSGDVFDVNYGMALAVNRAMGLEPVPVIADHISPDLSYHIADFQMRCLRYFKQAETLSVKGPYTGEKVKFDTPSIRHENNDKTQKVDTSIENMLADFYFYNILGLKIPDDQIEKEAKFYTNLFGDYSKYMKQMFENKR